MTRSFNPEPTATARPIAVRPRVSRLQRPCRVMVRRGLTLLEVMLALAIFGTSLAALGQLLSIGARCANDARDLTYAQLHCESLLAEITAGVRTAEAVSEAPIEIDPNWLYTIQVEAAQQMGLVSVTVTVERNIEPRARRASFSLVRWIPDPSVELSTSPADSTSAAAAPAGGASG